MEPHDISMSLAPGQSNAHAASGPEDSPPSISEHQLLRLIGKGSYGTVWLAKNMMGVYRAVKFVYRKSFSNQKPFERELSGIKKFEPISRSHEGFIDILHVGINPEEEYFYYVMELGDDAALGQKIDPELYRPKMLNDEITRLGRLPFQECLELGLALSLALAELHKRNLVHRDVKPSNIIFVNGVPKLADIGLVADVGEARSYVGTEGFIPPEGPGTPQADVYSLGKVLYEISTGKDRQDFPELPTLLGELDNKDRFLELNEVILQACHKDIKSRYQSAWDMHADLLVLANGKSVRRLKTLERKLSALKRIAGVVLLFLLLLGGVSSHFYSEWHAGIRARSDQDINSGNRAVESGDLLAALPFFADALRLDPGDAPQEIAQRLRFGSTLANTPKLTHFWSEKKSVRTGVFSPDGKRVLFAQLFGVAKIYDLESGELVGQPFNQDGGMSSGAFSPDSRFVVTTSEDRVPCVVWDLSKQEIILTLPHPDRVFNARFSRDGHRIVTSCNDNKARVWNSSTGTLELLLDLHTNVIIFADFSHDGRLIVTCSHDRTARLWDAATGHPIGSPLQHRDWVNYASFSPDDKQIVTACGDGLARVWDVNGGKFPVDMEHGAGVSSAEFSPDGQYILTASFDGNVRLWNSANLQPAGANSVLKHGEPVNHADFSPDGTSVVTSCDDGSVRVWSLAGTALQPPLLDRSFCLTGNRFLDLTNDVIEVRDSRSESLISHAIPAPPLTGKEQITSDGCFVLTITPAPSNRLTHTCILQAWDARTGKALAPGLVFSNSLNGAVLSSDGRRLLTYSDKTAQTWDVLNQRPLSPPVILNAPIQSGVWSPDSDIVATTGARRVSVWSAIDGHMLFKPLPHPFPVKHVAFSPDGSQLVTSCATPLLDKCFAETWNARTGQPRFKLRHNDGVLFACFSPDGRLVATAGEDFAVFVWEAASGKQLTPAMRHANQVKMVAFSPDNRWIVTTCADRNARVWDALTGYPLTPPLKHMTPLNTAGFLSDGRRIVTSDGKNHSCIWELAVNQAPIEDVKKIAQVLSGGQVILPGSLTNPETESLGDVWRKLKAKYPAYFTTTPGEIADWHEFAAAQFRIKHQWSAVIFHLKQLLLIQPNNPAILSRLAEAEEKLSKQDPANP